MEGLLIFATGIEKVVERHAIFYFIFVIIVKRCFIVIGGLYLGPCCIAAGREELCNYGVIWDLNVTVYKI